MINNAVQIYINGVNVSVYAVTPIKISNLLDESLDEIRLALRFCPYTKFNRLDCVEIVIDNTSSIDGSNKHVERKVYQMVVSSDMVEESPKGTLSSGIFKDIQLYNHDISAIEITKIAELVIVDTNTITNDLGRKYSGKPVIVIPEYPDTDTSFPYEVDNEPGYLTPIDSDGELFVKPCFYSDQYPQGVFGTRIIKNADPIRYLLTVEDLNGNVIFTELDYVNNFTPPLYQIYHCEINGVTVTDEMLWNKGFRLKQLENKIYKITYSVAAYPYNVPGNESQAIYYVSAISNQLPLKSWTITDVVNRLCDIAEPLYKGDTPRFKLNPEQAVKYDKILAPQFSFTKSTFRECLKQCGYIIHAEPRLKISEDHTYYEIFFEEYGGMNVSKIASYPYIKKSYSLTLEDYASCLDTNAENLINQNDKQAAVIVEPYAEGYKTVRTESLYTRINEENMLIKTLFPIYSIEKLECGAVDSRGNYADNQPIDITDYVFERSVYNTRLSSYAGSYPYSKAYAITYSQGDRNITSLNYKQPNPISPVFSRYAIINILREVTGDTSLTAEAYPLLAFRITYTPIYGGRIGQTKSNYKDFYNPAAMVYNQQSNLIESSNYGENLKGIIARLGNISATYTYNLSKLSEIPHVGDLFNQNTYISAAYTEIYPTFLKVSISLSEDFNRRSQYINVSSVKRFSEISMKQALERNTLWKNYIVVGDPEEVVEDDDKCFVNPSSSGFLKYVQSTFLTYAPKPLRFVSAYGLSYDKKRLPEIVLPVISSSFGNSISFSWEYEDNYSAGANSTFKKVGSISGYFSDNVPYTDYYGKMYYYNFELSGIGAKPETYDQQSEIGLKLPYGKDIDVEQGFHAISTISRFSLNEYPVILRKDNREKLQCNVQIDFVSNRKDLIIGSGLAARNPAIRLSDNARVGLYVLDEPINKFTSHYHENIDWNAFQLLKLEFINVKTGFDRLKLSLRDGTFTKDGKAWIIATQQTISEREVEDEFGNVSIEKIYGGGNILLASNINIKAGDAFNPIYFTVKKEVFNKSVWSDLK